MCLCTKLKEQYIIPNFPKSTVSYILTLGENYRQPWQKTASTNTQVQLGAFSALSVSNRFLLAMPQCCSPGDISVSFWVSGDHIFLPQYHQKGKESTQHASPYLLQMWSLSKNSGSRYCYLHFTGGGAENFSNLPKFTKPANENLGFRPRSFWPQSSRSFTMWSCCITSRIKLKIYQFSTYRFPWSGSNFVQPVLYYLQTSLKLTTIQLSWFYVSK